MLTVREALDAVLRESRPLEPVCLALSECLGLVAAEAAVSDVDSPPFDKALMDGFAVRAADFATADPSAGSGRFQIVEEILAGRVPTKRIGPGQAARIMTGAPVPAGADTVVRKEDAVVDEAARTVELRPASNRAGENILRQGASLKAGQTVLQPGRRLRPQEVGALAEIGKERMSVFRRPRVAVIATGDELVPIGATPGPGQIRNSNETMLCAQVRRAGGEPVALGIARDDASELRAKIHAGLACDVLLLSGGVSEGTHDLVPAELAAAGVRRVFHKVNLRPGKPLWFGVAGDGSSASVLVFGLPGNPVSSLVCFELFVRPSIRQLMGGDPRPKVLRAGLAREHVARGERATYNPARFQWNGAGSGEGATVEPVRWHGSSDLQATVDANCMAVFPGGDRTYRAGELVDVILWDETV